MIGIGLKHAHLPALLAGDRVDLDFVEVHAENVLGCGGPWPERLSRVNERHALSIHGVGLSLGGEGPLDADHLRALRDLLQRFQPRWFSEHLAWSTHQGRCYNDLLAVPYHAGTLARVCAHVDQTQEALGRRLLLENPSTYIRFASSTWDEADFLSEVVRRTGCGLLVDVNNAYVSAFNHGGDAAAYLQRLPAAAVGEIHLAGFAMQPATADVPALLIDTHGAPVAEAVWDLYETAVARFGAVPTLIERDQNLPPLDELLAEAHRARELSRSRGVMPLAVDTTVERTALVCRTPPNISLDAFAAALLNPNAEVPGDICGAGEPEGRARLDIHRNNVTVSITDSLADTFDVVRQLVGDDFFRAAARQYLREQPPASPCIWRHGEGFADFLAGYEPAASLPYLPDVARLEWLRHEAFRAGDAAPMPPAALAEALQDPQRLPARRLEPHPAVRLLRSPHPVVSIWSAHQGTADWDAVAHAGPEAALVFRDGHDATVTAVSHATATFIDAMAAGHTLGEAATLAGLPQADGHALDLSAALGVLITHQALHRLDMPTGDCP